MSTNLFARLRALLPAPPVLVGTVVAHNADGTSSVEIPSGVASAPLAPGLSTGSTLRARGTQVAVGLRAYVRDGVVEGEAPAGTADVAVVGTVAALPFGPARLSLGAPISAPAAALGVAYFLDLSSAWAGGYSPRTYTLTAGTLPTGLTLNSSSGVISGTRTVAGTASGLVVTCEDSTHRSVACAPFSIA